MTTPKTLALARCCIDNIYAMQLTTTHSTITQGDR
jgi:hypothetical protein